MVDISGEVIDLSNPIKENIPGWPTFDPVRFETTMWAARDGFTMERMEMNTHTSTHIDTPLHFIPEGKTIDDFPINKFMGEGTVIDLSDRSIGEPITPDELEPYADVITEDEVLMLYTGWDEHYGLRPEYLFEYPFLTDTAAQYLGDRQPKAVGIDTISVAGWDGEVPAQEPVTDIGGDESHLPLLENNIIPIEELRNLDQVLDGADKRRAFFSYVPLRFKGAGGSPVRAYAIV